jgi:glycosyltransferase involved in cell wall biosynthesis
VWVGSWRRNAGAIGVVGELVERLVLRLPVARYIAISTTVRDKLVAHGVDPERVTVIPCGVSETLVSAVRTGAAGKDHDVTVVGRLLPYKGVDVVLRAFAGVVRDRPRARLSVVGRGPEEARLRRLAARLGIEPNVTFHGFVRAHADVLDIVARGRLLVSASTVEGFGIVLVEAMALGVPYVATDIPAFREHAGVGGSLFAPGDAGALSATMRRLLDDDQLRDRLSLAGLELSRRYTWEALAGQTEAVYRELVETRRRGTRR